MLSPELDTVNVNVIDYLINPAKNNNHGITESFLSYKVARLMLLFSLLNRFCVFWACLRATAGGYDCIMVTTGDVLVSYLTGRRWWDTMPIAT